MNILNKILNSIFPQDKLLTTDATQIINEIQNVIRGAGLTPEAEVSLTGTSSSVGTAVTGSGTAFLTELRVGDLFYKDSAINDVRRVTNIASNVALTVDSAFASDFSGVACSVFNVTQLRTAINVSLDKYFIYGFVPSSGSDPDEEINITAGKARCEDGFTIVETAGVNDLNLATELGGALSADTTYNVYRYQRAADQAWHVEDSLSPTIGDMSSALAYRLIASYNTDGSGDLINHIGSGKGIEIFIKHDRILEQTGLTGSSVEYPLSSIPDNIPVRPLYFIKHTWNNTGSIISALADGIETHLGQGIAGTNQMDDSIVGALVETDTGSLFLKQVGTPPTDAVLYIQGYYLRRDQY